MTAAPPKPSSLRAALRTTFSPKKELGQVVTVKTRADHLVCVFESGLELELHGDPAEWVASLDAARATATGRSSGDD